MNFYNKKIKLFALILILSIALSALCASLPNANAHTPPWNVPTSAYVTCAPDPIGVGNQPLSWYGLTDTHPLQVAA